MNINVINYHRAQGALFQQSAMTPYGNENSVGCGDLTQRESGGEAEISGSSKYSSGDS